MRAVQYQTNTVNEKEIIVNVLVANGFAYLSDKNLLIREVDGGYIKISLTKFGNNILTFVKMFGHASFNLDNSPEHKRVAAKVASDLMAKYNDISE